MRPVATITVANCDSLTELLLHCAVVILSHISKLPQLCWNRSHHSPHKNFLAHSSDRQMDGQTDKKKEDRQRDATPPPSPRLSELWCSSSVNQPTSCLSYVSDSPAT